MDKIGTLLLYNAYALKELDGVVKNALSVQEDKSGIYMMVALVLKVTSWQDLDVKNQLIICVN